MPWAAAMCCQVSLIWRACAPRKSVGTNALACGTAWACKCQSTRDELIRIGNKRAPLGRSVRTSDKSSISALYRDVSRSTAIERLIAMTANTKNTTSACRRSRPCQDVPAIATATITNGNRICTNATPSRVEGIARDSAASARIGPNARGAKTRRGPDLFRSEKNASISAASDSTLKNLMATEPSLDTASTGEITIFKRSCSDP